MFRRRTERSNIVANNGLRPQNVSDFLAKLYLEYRLPFLHSVVLTGGVNHQSNYAANVANTAYLPGVTTIDLGGRFETTVAGHAAVLRIYATNITNRSYWTQETQLGDPVRVAVSGSVLF